MKRFLGSFGYALRGLPAGWRGQTNIRVMTALAIVAVASGWWTGLSFAEWAALVVVIGLVLALELLNTAGEKLVDILSPEHDDRYGQVKDILAAAVLLASIAAAITGLLIFLPHWLGGG